MIDDADDPAALLQTYIDDHGYLSWLGTRVETVATDRLVMTIPFDEKLTNTRPNGDDDSPANVHGGVAATLIDTAGGIALRPSLDDPIEDGVATINLTVNYLRPATGDLTATAEVIRAGSSVGVSTVTIESETPSGGTEPVATGQGAYPAVSELTERTATAIGGGRCGAGVAVGAGATRSRRPRAR